MRIKIIVGLVAAFVLSGCGSDGGGGAGGTAGTGGSGGGSGNFTVTDSGELVLVVDGVTKFATPENQGPVVRNFTETGAGIGITDFTRTNETADALSVTSATLSGSTASVLYANTGGDRTATLQAEMTSATESRFTLTVTGPAADSIAVPIRCDENGTFHGFGEQYNATNQRGEQFELFVNEQGNGRTGAPGISIGDEHTTYFPMPYYMDARGFGVLFDTARRVLVDLCATDADVAWIEVGSGEPVQWTVFHGPTPLDVIEQLGQKLGVPDEPPPWAFHLWLASQGGRAAVEADALLLETENIPASAFWVQDWTGLRMNLDGGFGVQYRWLPDETFYPNFAELVSNFHTAGYKFLTYANPFIVAEFEVPFDEMDAMGLLAKDDRGDTYVTQLVPNTPQSTAFPDWTNPATHDYVKGQLRDAVDTYGVDGWMTDFSEWLPLLTVPFDGSDVISAHNLHPQEWQRVVRAALEESRPDGDWVSFARAGWSGVQGVGQIHWVGDQETSFSPLDGLPTVIPAMLNLGLAGMPYVTHDIAGFGIGPEGPSTKELYMRWTELGAFTPIMRTHDGADKVNNWSWDRDADTIAHFRRFTFVHCALFSEWTALSTEAQDSSTPIIRHMMLEFPADMETWDISDQYMIGDSLLVAPIVEEAATTRSVYFPEGTWFNVWTGESVTGGSRQTVDGPIGSPPVYSLAQDRTDLRNAEMALAFEDCR